MVVVWWRQGHEHAPVSPGRQLWTFLWMHSYEFVCPSDSAVKMRADKWCCDLAARSPSPAWRPQRRLLVARAMVRRDVRVTGALARNLSQQLPSGNRFSETCWPDHVTWCSGEPRQPFPKSADSERSMDNTTSCHAGQVETSPLTRKVEAPVPNGGREELAFVAAGDP